MRSGRKNKEETLATERRRQAVKIRMSKALTVYCMALFTFVVVKVVNTDFSGDWVDVSAIVTALTVTGGIAGMCVKNYLNNSKAENIPRIQLSLFKDASKVITKTVKDVVEIQNDCGVDEDAIESAKQKIPIADVPNNILSQAIDELESKAQEAREDVDIESY